MKIRTYAIALALAGAPVLLAAQQTPPRDRADQRGAWQDRRGGRGMQGERQGREQALLRYRQQLGLSDAQAAARRAPAAHRAAARGVPPLPRAGEAAAGAASPEPPGGHARGPGGADPAAAPAGAAAHPGAPRPARRAPPVKASRRNAEAQGEAVAFSLRLCVSA